MNTTKNSDIKKSDCMVQRGRFIFCSVYQKPSKSVFYCNHPALPYLIHLLRTNPLLLVLSYLSLVLQDSVPCIGRMRNSGHGFIQSGR